MPNETKPTNVIPDRHLFLHRGSHLCESREVRKHRANCLGDNSILCRYRLGLYPQSSLVDGYPTGQYSLYRSGTHLPVSPLSPRSDQLAFLLEGLAVNECLSLYQDLF